MESKQDYELNLEEQEILLNRYKALFQEYIDFNHTINRQSNQFLKGIDRLNKWLFIVYHNPSCLFIGKNKCININNILNKLTNEEKYFVFSALIVLFQIFGDGNHRTAYEFFKSNTGRELTNEEKEIIERHHRNFEYYNLAEGYGDPVKMLVNIINSLVSEFRHLNSVRGGKIKNKLKLSSKSRRSKSKSRRSKSKSRRSKSKSRRSKTKSRI
jgi:hypothetical protein